jgi:6-phosphogluconate dehydrogenase (decarboxylating)
MAIQKCLQGKFADVKASFFVHGSLDFISFSLTARWTHHHSLQSSPPSPSLLTTAFSSQYRSRAKNKSHDDCSHMVLASL